MAKNLCYNSRTMINLADKLQRLPTPLADFLRQAGEIAAQSCERLYLVGGVVRDLLLDKANLDLDLVVEGDAIGLAQRLAQKNAGRAIRHPQFNTAKVEWNGRSADIAAARSETYAHPGALPSVQPDNIGTDLLRRDFTINAMALDLTPQHYGELIDLYGGQKDLQSRLIRILHERSFSDDATRIWRAIRYEQRLGFRLEQRTLELLKRGLNMLDTISGDRIRYELECVLAEAEPEKALRRAAELGVLQKVSPGLRGDDWLAEKLRLARKKDLAGFAPGMCLLAYRLPEAEIEKLAAYLRLDRELTRALRDLAPLKEKAGALADPEIKNSRIYSLLNGYPELAVATSALAAEPRTARRNLELYLTQLRHVRTELGGADLLQMGIPPGPQIKELLSRLLAARLDGEASCLMDEIALVKRLTLPF